MSSNYIFVKHVLNYRPTYVCVGGFAFVFVAQDLKDGKEYALKVCIHFMHWSIIIHLTSNSYTISHISAVTDGLHGMMSDAHCAVHRGRCVINRQTLLIKC